MVAYAQAKCLITGVRINNLIIILTFIITWYDDTTSITCSYLLKEVIIVTSTMKKIMYKILNAQNTNEGFNCYLMPLIYTI